MTKSVAILGGGVAGLSAAQELVERDYEVTVYEKNDMFGGKARSLSVPNTATGGRKDLPGEHGFRFFPRFYKHLPDTMKRIPFAGNQCVFDNLVDASRIEVARSGKVPLILTARIPQGPQDLAVALHTMFTGIGVSDPEVLYFVDRLLVLLTSCPERRLAEYEQIAWWNFVGAESRSKEYQTLLAQGLTRSLVAMRAEDGSTRTVGYMLLQLLFGLLTSGGFDRLLAGPTNEVWLNPWLSYLKGRGVTMNSGVRVQQIHAGSSGITSVSVVSNGQPQEITADYYIAAMPVEVMTMLVTDELKKIAPSIANLNQLPTRWMNGIQFYLAKDVPLEHGHTLYSDSPWALTSISQKQFWQRANLTDYGDGHVGGLLSVDISDWDANGILLGKPATQCTAEEIKDEVWAELKAHLNVGAVPVIEDQNLLSWFLDPDIQFPNPSAATNTEPLMINKAGTWKYRPEATTEIPNLFLASDYVRTYTDIACMEAANEAARRAVNGILARSGASTAPASIWPLQEPEFFKPMIEYDRLRFKHGLPHGTFQN